MDAIAREIAARSAPGNQRCGAASGWPGGAPGRAKGAQMSVTGFPGAPKMLRGGLVQLDPNARSLVDVVVFQYNPDTLTRTLQPRAIGGEPGDRLEVLRLTGPPHETIKFDAEIDAADQLENPADSANQPVVDAGTAARPGVLERLITPTSAELLATDALFDQRHARGRADGGTPDRARLGGQASRARAREQPDAHRGGLRPQLQPIRVKAGIECKVLTSSDLPLQHVGGTLYIAYRQPRNSVADAGHQLGRATAGTGAPAMSVSRYANVGQAVWTAPDGSQVPYLLRRFLPAPGTIATASLHQVALGERIDTIADAALGDPSCRGCSATPTWRRARPSSHSPGGCS